MIIDTSLVYFYEVARRGSIRQAAEHLYVSPSAISRMIKKAERLYQADLFERDAKGMKLTEAGRILEEQLRGVHVKLREARTRIDELNGLHRGDVRIFCIEGMIQTLLPQIIASFHQRYPNIRFSIYTGGSDSIIKALLDDQADLGVAFNMEKQSGITTLATYTHAMQVLVAPGHPLAAKSSVSLKETVRYPMAMPDPSFGVRTLLERSLQARGLKIPMLLTTNSLALTRAVAQTGEAITLTPAFTAVDELEMGRLVAIPLSKRDVMYGVTTIFQRKGRRLSVAALEFKDYFLKQYQEVELRANAQARI